MRGQDNKFDARNQVVEVIKPKILQTPRVVWSLKPGLTSGSVALSLPSRTLFSSPFRRLELVRRRMGSALIPTIFTAMKGSTGP